MSRVVTFGELMLRLAPEGYCRFFQTDRMQAIFGGCEANVAASLAEFGLDSVYVTKLPEHAIGQAAVNSLRWFGVDTGKIVRGGERVGLYYCEKGASQRSGLCVYDRKYSAISQARPEEFDWDEILDGADLFHVSGITAALGGALPEICRAACETCRRKGVPVSFDVNYRASLWTRAQAAEVLRTLVPYADILFCGPQDADAFFGVPSEEPLSRAGYADLCKRLCAAYDLRAVSMTMRESKSASDHRFSAMLYQGGQAYFSRAYDLHIVDRVGGGDAFAAGLLYGLLTEMEPQHAVEFAAAAGALKHSVEGDQNRVSVQEVEKLAVGDGDGRVRR